MATAGREITPIERKQKKIADVFAAESAKKQIQNALPRHMSTERMIRVLMTQVSKNDKLARCSEVSLGKALVLCSEYGLEPNGIECHLVPFGNEVQVIPDYKGLIRLAYRSGTIQSIRGQAVREKDHFVYSFGLHERLEHEPSNDEDPGPLTHAYAVAHMKGGGHNFVVLNRREVMDHKASSSSAGGKSSPWNDPKHEPSMWAKTAVRVLSKFIPLSAEFVRVASASIMEDTEYPTIDVQPSMSGRKVPRSSLGAPRQPVEPVEDEAHLDALDICTTPESVDEAVKDMLSEGVPPEDEDYIRSAGETRKRQLGGKLFDDEPPSGERSYPRE